MDGMSGTPVMAIELSQNRKLGYVSSTYASQVTCPESCPFRNAGCYAESGRMALHTRRLNNSPVDDFIEVAEREAEAIRKLSGRFPLRLHVVGDCKTEAAARIVSKAADEHTSKRGQPVWTYTHAHDVPREAWGNVSVLRSCESISQVEEALDAGYAAAMVVPQFRQDTAYEVGPGLIGIPCPEMTGRAESCEECGLCMRAEKLRAGRRVILFEAHGNRKAKVAQTIAASG